MPSWCRALFFLWVALHLWWSAVVPWSGSGWTSEINKSGSYSNFQANMWSTPISSSSSPTPFPSDLKPNCASHRSAARRSRAAARPSRAAAAPQLVPAAPPAPEKAPADAAASWSRSELYGFSCRRKSGDLRNRWHFNDTARGFYLSDSVKVCSDILEIGSSENRCASWGIGGYLLWLKWNWHRRWVASLGSVLHQALTWWWTKLNYCNSLFLDGFVTLITEINSNLIIDKQNERAK